MTVYCSKQSQVLVTQQAANGTWVLQIDDDYIAADADTNSLLVSAFFVDAMTKSLYNGRFSYYRW